MSDRTDLPDAASKDNSLGPGTVTQAEIDGVLDDPTLSVGEKQARLEELRGRLLEREHAAHDEDYMPFETKIMDALSMLADGGHDYGAVDPATDGNVEDRRD